MGKKKQLLPTVRHGEAHFFRPAFQDGNFSVVPLGRARYANELFYGYLAPNWRKALEPFAPAHSTDQNWKDTENALERYIFNRASELGAVPRTDAVRTLDRIKKAAAELLAASDTGEGSSLVWTRIEAVGGAPFSRDDFYPLLSALNQRVHLLPTEMNAERERGDQLSVGAFRHFVLDLANCYATMRGEVRVRKISDSNCDAARPTPFSLFAWEAMKQMPVRQHCSNPRGWSFFDALDDELSLLRKGGALPKKAPITSP
jgi:hypothetical protein